MTIDDNIYLTDIHLLCTACHQPIKARITTAQWLRVEWIGPSGECLRCFQKMKETNNGNQKESSEVRLLRERRSE